MRDIRYVTLTPVIIVVAVERERLRGVLDRFLYTSLYIRADDQLFQIIHPFIHLVYQC